MKFTDISRKLFLKETRPFSSKEVLIQFSISFFALLLFFMLYRFHVLTTAEWNVGWVKHVIWRNPLQEMPIDCCSLDGSNSRFIAWSWHFTPLFSISSFFSYFWPFGQQTWLLLFLSLPYALIIYCCIYFGLVGWSQSARNIKQIWVISLFSTYLGLSFGTFRSISYPQYEIYFLSFFLLFLMFLHKNQHSLASLALLACVSVKEDSAFYLAILFLAFFWTRKNSLEIIIKSIMILSPSLIYLLALQLIPFEDPIVPGTGKLSNLEIHYLGNPPFSHLSLHFLKERILLSLRDNTELYLLTLLICLKSFQMFRNKSIRLIAALTPHFLVAIIGISSVKGGWALYHQIPVWTTLLFCIIFIHLNGDALFKSKFIASLLFLCCWSTLSYSAYYIHQSIKSDIELSQIVRNVDRVIVEGKARGDIFDPIFFVYDPINVSLDDWLNEHTDFKHNDCLISLKNSKSIPLLKETLQASNVKVNIINNAFQRTCFPGN